jgi:peptide-methionine (S)-S-oxide reductase
VSRNGSGGRRWPAALAAVAIAVALAAAAPATADPPPPATAAAPAADAAPATTATAVFAGGCFWCMEPPFEKLDGVVAVQSGYSGGRVANPTYAQVSAGGTGHYEAVEVTYDPGKVSYERLLDVFWRNIDPVDDGGQFCDRGDQYRAAVFYLTPAQQTAAAASKAAIEAGGKVSGRIVTPVLPAAPFFPAEDYHQDYYKKNPLRYFTYRTSCGRDRRLAAVWGGS